MDTKPPFDADELAELVNRGIATVNNAIALFEEMQANGDQGPETLYAWWLGEQDVIAQTIAELKNE